MRGSIDQLGSWAKSELKYWERAALAKIADYTELTDDDINELVRYFVEDAGLAPIASSRPPLPLLDGEAAESGRPPCRLNRISDLRNVNALPNGQEIRFGPQLTLIYGDNGAGKSGYARALGAACFARGDRKVLPNATGSESKQIPQAAIEISYSTEIRQIPWSEGRRCPELSGFYFFDSSSLKVHLTRSNSLSFTPAGLLQGGGGRGGDAGPPAGGAPTAPDPTGGLSLFDAVNRQLGLKLEMHKRTMPVLVIDHVDEKPTDN